MNTTLQRTKLSPWMIGVGALLFWTLVGLFFASQIYLRTDNGWVDAARIAMPRWYIWGVLTPLIIWADRLLHLRQKPLGSRLLWHVPLGIFWTMVYMLASLVVEGWVWGQTMALDTSFFARHFHWDLLIYGLILGAHIARDYYVELQQRELKATQLEGMLAEARLHTLQTQLHPHFLFNTLNAISAFIEKEPQTARRMMAFLGDLLRSSLDVADRQTITLEEELAFLENYLAIERIRFEDQLTISTDVAPEVLKAQVPSLLLQPLVENAIRHGITTRASVGHIAIQAHRDGDQLVVAVCDNGIGLPPGWRLEANKGLGLSNTVGRLEHLYNGQHVFAIDTAEGGGVCVEVRLPFYTDSVPEEVAL